MIGINITTSILIDLPTYKSKTDAIKHNKTASKGK